MENIQVEIRDIQKHYEDYIAKLVSEAVILKINIDSLSKQNEELKSKLNMLEGENNIGN